MTRLRILLVGNYLPDKQKSMSAYADMLLSILGTQSGVDVRLMRVPVFFGKVPRAIWASKLFALMDKYLVFWPVLFWRARSADVVHICDHSNALYGLPFRRGRVVVTCHDVLAIKAAHGAIAKWQTSALGRLLQKANVRGLAHAGAVICVSEYTKREVESLGISSSNVSVALNPLNAAFSQLSRDKISRIFLDHSFLRPGRYLLHVGSDHIRKNRIFVLKIFNELARCSGNVDLQLVFVGPNLNPEMAAFATENGLGDRIVCLPNVSHEFLNALYSAAEALIFPSFLEGFGWPIIEAQASGCPVATTNAAPMSEVAGNGAELLDLDDLAGSALAVLRLIDQGERVRPEGLGNVRRFSRENVADACVRAYAHAAGR